MDHFLRLPQVKEVTGLARSTIYMLIAQGQFPRPVPLGPQAVGWVAAEIDAWAKARIAARGIPVASAGERQPATTSCVEPAASRGD